MSSRDHSKTVLVNELPDVDVPQQTVLVEISSLLPADSPRLGGENLAHTRTLAEADSLPPILVHRRTMRVVDGMHRLHAAILNGRHEIEAQFVDGGPEATFVLAVAANVAHGLPLSLADREAAAARILTSLPQWSNRAVAAATGLSDKTVAAIRCRATAEFPQLPTRIGRDGRVRRVNVAEGRRQASQLIAACPNASLRAIARASGVSPGTVRDVRDRMRRGEDPIPPRKRAAADKPDVPDRTAVRGVSERDRSATLHILRRDPSLRFSAAGRLLLQMLGAHSIDTRECTDLADVVPSHCVNLVADLARGCASAWLEFADELERRRLASA